MASQLRRMFPLNEAPVVGSLKVDSATLMAMAEVIGAAIDSGKLTPEIKAWAGPLLDTISAAYANVASYGKGSSGRPVAVSIHGAPEVRNTGNPGFLGGSHRDTFDAIQQHYRAKPNPEIPSSVPKAAPPKSAVTRVPTGPTPFNAGKTDDSDVPDWWKDNMMPAPGGGAQRIPKGRAPEDDDDGGTPFRFDPKLAARPEVPQGEEPWDDERIDQFLNDPKKAAKTRSANLKGLGKWKRQPKTPDELADFVAGKTWDDNAHHGKNGARKGPPPIPGKRTKK